MVEGLEGTELNRIITEQALSTHSMVQKTDWFEICWIILLVALNKPLYSTTAVLVYY